MGRERKSKRIFEGEIRNKTYTMLLLASVSDENGRSGIAQPLLYAVGEFEHA